MAVILEKKNSQYFANRKRRYRKIITTIIISIIIIVIAMVLFLICQLNNIEYTDYTVTQSIERKDSAYTQYINYNEGLLRYSKDGAMYINRQGEFIWNSTYDMHNPIPDISGEYIVISDLGNKNIEVFNKSGHVISLEVLYPIMKVEVASQGVVAVLMDGGDVNYIQLYSTTGQNLIDSRTTVEKNGFAVDFSMSNDGNKLVTSYISINDGLIQSKVTFYNFGRVGQNYEARIVGGFDYGQTLVSKVEFINNNTIVAFGDDKFSIYKMEEIPELIYEEAFQTEIKSIAYNDKYIGIIQKNNSDSEGRYLLTVYNEEGNKVLNEEISYNYNQFKIANGDIIFNSNTDLNILRINGKAKINATFDNGLKYAFPMGLKDEYLIVDQSSINKVKLVK